MRNFRIEYTGSSKLIRRICEKLNEVPILGTTHDCAYYGDRGEEAYQHSKIQGNPHGVTLEDLGLADIQSQIQALLNASGTQEPWYASTPDEEEFNVVDDTDDEFIFSFVEDTLIWS